MFDKEKDRIDRTIQRKTKKKQEEKIYLGKFIEYIPIFYVIDLLINGKARFENSIISCGHYKFLLNE